MQIVGYDAADGGLLITADSGSAVDYQPLEAGTELDYRLGERHCAGTIDDDTHISCANPTAPYCEHHDSTWVCACCTGSCLKDEMDCYEKHALYLAAFGPATFKVGVTRLWRLETRLREQGADRAAHISTVENGRIAREREAEIAESIPDRVRVPTKMAGLAQSVDTDRWNALLAEFDPIETFQFAYGLELDRQPVAETVAAGTVRGTKGRILVLDRNGSTYAVDMRDLVGYTITEGSSCRELQSSLGAFD